jgi:hypothetical protein
MADLFIIPELQNQVIDTLDEARMVENNCTVPEPEYHYVWESAIEESGLRLYIYYTWPDNFMHAPHHPLELFVQVMQSQRDIPNPVSGLDRKSVENFSCI